jgi:protein O-mannosyl-transferase
MAILIGYAHIFECGFVSFDDNTHVTANRVVVGGLQWDSIKAAFTEPHASLWIPLTWLSFMIDVSIFGLNAKAMHIENVLFHAANAVLLFLFLKRATSRFWPSAAVAALFAIHPINVESVAWVTERKNVLSLFFGLLSLHAYVSYARRNSKTAYVVALILFVFSVLAKPMMVALPPGLILLDIWPFRRIDRTNWLRRVLEKVPFLLFTIVSCVMTMKGPIDADSTVPFHELPIGLRLANAATSYGVYLRQLAWPHDLCILYSYQRRIDVAALSMSLIVLVGITLAAWRWRLRFPYLIIGWLWYLGMLVPMIGLVQVGSQAHADRFTYTAQIGIFVAVIWLIADLWGERPRRYLTYASSVAGIGLMIMTLRQVQYWTHGATLFERAIAVEPASPMGYAQAGFAWLQLGECKTAVSRLQTAVQRRPDFVTAWKHLAVALLELGRNAEAAKAAQEALKLEPKSAAARLSLSSAYDRMGQIPEAIEQYRKLLEVDPNEVEGHVRLGMLLAEQGNTDAAKEALANAVRLRPNDPWIAKAHELVSAGLHDRSSVPGEPPRE